MSGLLVLTELFLPTKGGTAVWAAEVYRRMGGKEIHIVTADVPGAHEIDATHPNTIHRLDLRRVPWLRPESLAMYLRLFWKSVALATSNRFDAIHAFRALPEGLVAWLVARMTFRPALIYAHGEELTTWGRGGKFKMMRLALRHCDRVIANSEYTRNELLKCGVRDAKISIISPGVDLQRFRPGIRCDDLRTALELEANEKLILSVGRLSRRKGFDTVIRSLPALLGTRHRVRYAIIGIGEDEGYLKSLAEEVGVADRVHLLGHVEVDDLSRWYNAADVFAMPNRAIDGDTEGFGIVFLEAAACGTPALAGTAGGTGAAVIDGVTGLRVDGERVDSVALALMRLLVEDGNALGANGCLRARKSFDWDQVALMTEELQHRITQGSHRA